MKEDLLLLSARKATEEETEIFMNLSAEGKDLPENVVVKESVNYDKDGNSQTSYTFYVKEDAFSKEDEDEYLKLLNAKNIRTIKKISIFFFVLAIIGICAGIIVGLVV